MVRKHPVDCPNCGERVFDDFPSLMVFRYDVVCQKCGTIVIPSRSYDLDHGGWCGVEENERYKARYTKDRICYAVSKQ